MTFSFRILPRIFLALGLGASVGSACQRPAPSSTTTPAASARPAEAALNLPNPVLPGDFPDPSVVKVGATYWASATSSNWGPALPLLKSSNLTSWELVGHVFPAGPPAWADYYFWAPEIWQDQGKTYVFYSAHKRGGNLAVGVASAPDPAGPYTDHGPLVAEPAGSIDGFPMRDENGQLYLIWKEDGNSVQRPTPIWAQRLNDERTALVGEKQELFHNEPATWEGNLVEGVSMVRHGGYFYAFYAGNGCCGHGCTYATGVARAKNLLGPWEKYAQNPVLVNNDTWRCPGHGTAIEHEGRWYLLHHAYAASSQEFVGRQGVLSEFTWTAAGWPEFRGGSTPVAATAPQPRGFTDEFTGKNILPSWQWPIEQRPAFRLAAGRLQLTARPDHAGAALGQSTTSAAYTASTTLLNASALPQGCRAGLAAHGDPDNVLALLTDGKKLLLVKVEKAQRTVLAETPLPADNKALELRLQAREGSQFTFAWSADGGTTWQNLSAAPSSIDGRFLPPWDRGIRVGLLAQGPATASASFESFSLRAQP